MLSPKTQTKLANAKGYFEEHLCAGDYYAENGRVQGVWMGARAVRLGLEGAVTREAFLSLCDNRYPASRERLTQRQKTTRNDKVGGEAANRRVCIDFTISPPKSVSIAALVADDSRIVTAHREAVTAAVAELEGFACFTSARRSRFYRSSCCRSSILPSGWAKTSPSCARKERSGRRRLTLLPIESLGYRNLRHDSSAMKRDTHLNVIGPEIRRIRKQRGWSQSKLAHHLQPVGWNISRSGLAKIECRIMGVGDFELLYFVRALGVGIKKLFPPASAQQPVRALVERSCRT
jgi:hypothetical protein